jgi:hypothetical protein
MPYVSEPYVSDIPTATAGAVTGSTGRARQRMPRGLIVVGILIAAIVGYALYAGVGALRQHPTTGLVSHYQVVGDSSVHYRMTISGPPDSTVACAVVARADDFSVVGQVERKIRLDDDGHGTVRGTLTTLRRASNAEAGTCQPG